MSDPCEVYFERTTTPSERAAFEAGIALATLFHQFTGMPLPRKKTDLIRLARAMESSIMAQPFRRKVKVRILKVRGEAGVYGYHHLDPKNLEATVEVEYKRARVTARLRWIKDVNYPLMYIEEVKRNGQR
ncbi:MAG: dihydroneopterin aldolase family protein [Aigarchaeota archaeon]|nr:dihydroneopterin aldolase family protein [Aigarchaeota archaeon]MDW8092773.1 dihydroneopterin aldolase family protein [Nitrososphaerota archaeon]